MKFTVATFVTLVAAAAAMPREQAAPSISQKSQKKIDALKNQCGDVNIQCCIDVPKDVNEEEYSGLGGVLSHLINTDSQAFCSPASGQGLIPINLQGLLGKQDSHICDAPNVTYACCTGDSKCDVLNSDDDDKKGKKDKKN